uniref:ATP synthase subunit a n=1 Tax=Dryophytes arenicolor TaxID=251751 RepID=D9ZKT8_9NEOB|nr:ATPase 6 [Dryophytes arenicolor]ADK87483.1 ATPase 6 [Dryophytes arenicolor]ADK87488.1 ATPase 6 [Dryophytes arenicolor]ADK87495.1 ATPase 6 [Dryophytes arenicolor]ADK87513.1 ATPase 6 [Dryophytes arenicolor]
MILNLFSQFASPNLLGLPLIFIALLAPWFMFPTPCSRWLTNRVVTIQTWFVKTFTKQIFSPLNTPGHKWALILTSLMIFLLGMNLLGLLPYTFTPTTQLSLNLGLAIPLWLATVAIGFRNQLTASLGHFLPEGTPTPLIPILIIIETISLFIRPMALGVRLTANLTAGHLLIQLISSATLALLFSSPIVSALTFITLILLTMLEIAVAMIQAYVFVLLLSLYLQENT